MPAHARLGYVRDAAHSNNNNNNNSNNNSNNKTHEHTPSLSGDWPLFWAPFAQAARICRVYVCASGKQEHFSKSEVTSVMHHVRWMPKSTQRTREHSHLLRVRCLPALSLQWDASRVVRPHAYMQVPVQMPARACEPAWAAFVMPRTAKAKKKKKKTDL